MHGHANGAGLARRSAARQPSPIAQLRRSSLWQTLTPTNHEPRTNPPRGAPIKALLRTRAAGGMRGQEWVRRGAGGVEEEGRGPRGKHSGA